MKPIILSDESVNVYGFRVLTKGIDLSQFNNNPVMLYNHRRSGRWDDSTEGRLPIGKWTEVKKVDGALVAVPEFDADDDFAVKVGNKYEKGYLNAASIGFDIIEMSEDVKLMVPGQTRPTITKCRLKEASIADIPANANCVKLSYQGVSLTLDGNGDGSQIESILPTINQQSTNKSEMDKKLILQTLGMGDDASDAQVVGKLTELVNQKNTIVDLQKKLSDIELAQKQEKTKKLVADAVAAGKITAAQSPLYEKLADSDYEGTEAVLAAMTPYVQPNKVIEGKEQKADAALSDYELYVKLDKEGGLKKLSQEEPERFVKLQEAYVNKLKATGVLA